MKRICRQNKKTTQHGAIAAIGREESKYGKEQKAKPIFNGI
jgi:hypothetical protein